MFNEFSFSIRFCLDPLFDQRSLSWFETVSSLVESYTNVLKDIERGKALGGAIARKLNDILNRAGPARIWSMQSQIRDGHAQPLGDLFCKARRIKQTEYFIA